MLGAGVFCIAQWKWIFKKWYMGKSSLHATSGEYKCWKSLKVNPNQQYLTADVVSYNCNYSRRFSTYSNAVISSTRQDRDLFCVALQMNWGRFCRALQCNSKSAASSRCWFQQQFHVCRTNVRLCCMLTWLHRSSVLIIVYDMHTLSGISASPTSVAARGQGAPGQMTWLKGFRLCCWPGFRPGCDFFSFKRQMCIMYQCKKPFDLLPNVSVMTDDLH